MRRAFTIIELLIVMAVIAILVGIAIPSFRAMQIEAWRAKAQGDLRVLKLGTETYYKNHGFFPATGGPALMSALLGETNPVVESAISDPFAAANTPYAYSLSGSYYAIWSLGPNNNGAVTIVGNSAEATSGAIYVTNGR